MYSGWEVKYLLTLATNPYIYISLMWPYRRRRTRTSTAWQLRTSWTSLSLRSSPSKRYSTQMRWTHVHKDKNLMANKDHIYIFTYVYVWMCAFWHKTNKRILTCVRASVFISYRWGDAVLDIVWTALYCCIFFNVYP